MTLDRRHLIAILASLACLLLQARALGGEPAYFSGYAGILPSVPENLAKTYFNRPEVRHLIGALQRGPLSEQEVKRRLAGTPTKFSDLTRLRLIALNRGQVRIAFAYFSVEDMRRIHAVAAQFVPSLVAAYRSHAKELAGILSRYPVTSVSRRRLAFVLLAGFSLNWDGLRLLSDLKLRQPRLVRGRGWQYSFWASGETPEYSYKGYYWGSTTFPAGAINLHPPLDFTFSSFGDPFSDPRLNFPDLFLLPPEAMTPGIRQAAEALGLREDSTLGSTIRNVIGLDRARGVGATLFAMRHGVREEALICAALPRTGRDACGGTLSLLVAAGYIKHESDGSFVLLVPVFDRQDERLVAAVLAVSRKTMTAWLKRNYRPIRQDLADLTALRQGVPYPALFTQIWHELFGLTTHELVSSGLIEDPYSADPAWKASIPVVWRTAIYRRPFE